MPALRLLAGRYAQALHKPRERIHMKSFLIFFAILFSLNVQSQIVHNKDSSQLIYVDDIENYVYFPGGDSAFHSYLSNKLVYPDSIWENGIKGIVYVQFSVDTTGKISDVKIIKGLAPDIDKTVLSVISNMPTWQWTIKNRRKCIKTLPIEFTAKK